MSANIIDASNFDFLDYLPELNSNTIDQTITIGGVDSLNNLDDLQAADVNSLESCLFNSFPSASSTTTITAPTNQSQYYSTNQANQAYNY